MTATKTLSLTALFALAAACSSPKPVADPNDNKADEVTVDNQDSGDDADDKQPAGNSDPEATCDASAPALVVYRDGPDVNQDPAKSIAIHTSGHYDANGKTGCLSADDLKAVTDLVNGTTPTILSSNQNCPKPASRSFTLEITGKDKLSWSDGGCGTELHESVNTLLAKIADVTK